jgi:hypothetical protein
MSVVESKACCESDAQYMRLQGIMATLEETSPEDVIALLRKCVTMLGNELQVAIQRSTRQYHRIRDLKKTAAAHTKAKADRHSRGLK